jgi:putative ABC transport system permease protein
VKGLFLIRSGLLRKPLRTVFTVASLAVGFLLFGLLQGVDTAFDQAVERLRADRLLVDPRFDEPLLQSDVSVIQEIEGITDVTWTQFFAGGYQQTESTVIVLTTEPESFFKVRNEYETSPEHLEALRRTPNGLIVWQSLADEMGWQIGDQVPLMSNVQRLDGEPAWTFEVVGFMDWPDNPGGVPFTVANYAYLDEARVSPKGVIGRFVVRIADPRQSVEVARAIDDAFRNSPRPTFTQIDDQRAQAELATIGDVSRLTVAVIIAVFFAIVFLAGNVVLQSVRERIGELAVLKTVGFSDARVLMLVTSEALVLCVAGAVLGLVGTAVVFPFIAPYLLELSLYLGTPRLSPSVFAWGLLFAGVLTVLSAALPAWHAKRLSIVDALRRRV